MTSDPQPALSLLDLLNQGWLGLLVGVASVVLFIVLYYRGPRRGRLATEWIGTPLLGYQDADVLPSAVTIQYRGAAVPRVGFTDVLLWNGGGDTLRGEDVVAADLLRVQAPEGTHILDAVLVHVTRSAGGWDARIDPKRPHVVCVTFGYAEVRDGVCLRVVHTGANLALPVRGEVRGMPDGIAQLGQLGPNRLPYAGWRAAVAQARREQRPWRRTAQLARLSRAFPSRSSCPSCWRWLSRGRSGWWCAHPQSPLPAGARSRTGPSPSRARWSWSRTPCVSRSSAASSASGRA